MNRTFRDEKARAELLERVATLFALAVEVLKRNAFFIGAGENKKVFCPVCSQLEAHTADCWLPEAEAALAELEKKP